MREYMFWLNRLYVNKNITFHVYDKEGLLMDCIGIEQGEEDPFQSDASLYQTLKANYQREQIPGIYMEQEWAAYMIFTDERENLYIGGPVNTESEQDERNNLYQYRRKHSLSYRFQKMPQLSLLETANLLSMALYGITGQCIEEGELLKLNTANYEKQESTISRMTNYRFESWEEERTRMEYHFEREYTEAIRTGNLEYFERPMEDKVYLENEIGKMAEGKKKQHEYMAATVLAIASRAAIEGGISPAQAYTLSDVYFQKLEKCKTDVEILSLILESQKAFAVMVNKYKQQKRKSYHVERCKDYLSQNIHKRITVEELAKKLGVNRTYLSGTFSAQEGMSISQYSIMVRLQAAENMLRYSEASVSEIAEYLCFSSQSHLGKEFKKKNGISPAEYRKQHQNTNFITK